MPIKWGSTYVTAVKWGSTNCTEVYWGSTKVFPIGGYDGTNMTYPLHDLTTFSSSNFLHIPDRKTVLSDFHMNGTGLISGMQDMYLSIRTTYTIDMSLYTKLDIDQGENNGGVESRDTDHGYGLRYVGFSSNYKTGVSTDTYKNGICIDLDPARWKKSYIGIDISQITGDLYFVYMLNIWKTGSESSYWYNFNMNSIKIY